MSQTSAMDGLCPGCAYVRTVESSKGSTFLRCDLAKSDPRYGKYPPQPRVRCEGYVAKADDGGGGTA
jgi:hypothetical protein